MLSLPDGSKSATRAWASLAILLASCTAYIGFFPALHGIAGCVAGILGLLPVILAGALMGPVGGVVAGVALVPLQAFLHRTFGLESSLVEHVVGGLTASLAGGLVGQLRDAGRRALASRQALSEALAQATQVASELREREIELSLAQEVSATGNWVWDVGADEVRWSKELFRICGIAEGTRPSAEAYRRLIHPEDRARVNEARERALVAGKLVEIDYRLIRPDGSVRFVHVSMKGYPDSTGRQRMLGTLRDITERVEQRRKLAKADSLASVVTLAGGVAHEINNPLAVVAGNAAFVVDGLSRLVEATGLSVDEVRELREAAADAVTCADRIREIVQRLQGLTRTGMVDAPVEVRSIVEHAVGLVESQARARARLVTEFAPDLPSIAGDPARLAQVVVELLINAIHAIPEGRPEANEIRIAARPDGAAAVALEVCDTGQGIPAEFRSQLFDPFFTTKPLGCGKGLGLSTCHSVVASMGGEISVESELGTGTTFVVRLPAYEMEKRTTGVAPTGAAAAP